MYAFFKFFLQNSKLTFVLTFTLFVYGWMGFNSLQRETRPSVDFARVIISTAFPGASTKEVEEQVTFKIEEQIQNVDGIVDARSISSPGYSLFSIRLDLDNIDTKDIVDELQDALTRVKNLPSSILNPPFLKHIKAKDIPLLRIIITGPNDQRKRDRLAFKIKSILEKDTGVAEIQLGGYHPRELKIILDPKALTQNHVGVDEVLKSIKNNTKDFSAGVVRTSSDVKQVRFLGKTISIEDIENIVVRSNFSGQKILVKDLAQVQDDKEEIKTIARFDDQPMTYLLIKKKEKSDSIQLSESIKKIMNSYPMPKNYNYTIYDNEAETTKNRLSTVVNNAWIGFICVLLVLILLLPGKLGLVSSISLPISILGAVAICSSFGITFNAITMLAFIICIGMLVDNSVVVSENFARLQESNMNSAKASLHSVLQLYRPISATVLTTISAFLPMLVVKGIMGQFIMWIPIVVSVALAVSLFDAFILLPSRLNLIASKQKIKKITWIQKNFNALMIRFEKWVTVCIHRRYLVFSSLVFVILFSVSINFWGNQFILFPKDDVLEYIVNFETPKGTSIKKNDEISRDLIKKIVDVTGQDQIEGLLSQVGGSSFGWQAEENVGDMILTLKEESIYRTDPQKLLKKLRKIDKKDLETLEFNPMGGGPPVGDAVHVVFNSQNRQNLSKIAEDFKNELSKVEGVLDVKDDQVSTGLEYNIYPNHKQLAEVQLSSLSLSATLQTALQGVIVGDLVEDGESFYIRVYYDKDVRTRISSLKEIKILSPNGGLIPLEKLLIIKENPQGSKFKKSYNFQPSIEVTAKVEPSIITSEEANNHAEKILNQLLKKHQDFSYLFIGERRHTKESMTSLFQAMILAVFGIFMILLIMFKGFMLSILSLSSIFLGLIGVSLSFALHQKPLSFLALIGVVGLAGVTINASIILVSFIEDLRKENPEASLIEILSKSSRYRFKPIVITTFTTVIGLFPSAYSIGGHDSMLIPVTLAFTWGLSSGSLLTLIWIPCGYAIIEDIKNKFFKPKEKLG